ncbi:MAG: LysR family transcriptional regulator [Wenzhouxiangella sp.]
MDRIEAMQLFVRITELGSFAAVAQQLGVARSVVTRKIAALESHLGVKLLARSTRKLSLTFEGAAYLEQCRTILELVEGAEADLAEGRSRPQGRIRASIPLSFGLRRLTPVLIKFSREYPELGLELDYSDRQVNLIEEGFDLAVRITARLEPTDIVRRLGGSRLLVLASPAYLAEHGHPKQPRDLTRHECLAYSARGSGQSWEFRVDGKPETVHIHCRVAASSGDALMSAAIAGLGITRQPDFIAADDLAAGRVVSLLDDYAPPPLGIYAVLPGNRHVPLRVRVLIDYLAESLASGGDVLGPVGRSSPTARR